MIAFDTLVIGGGGAGLRAAIAAAEYGGLVGMMSKISPLRSTTGCTGGGINAVLEHGKIEDGFEKHAYDTIIGGGFLGDQDAIDFFVQQAPTSILELDSYGTPFLRNHEGLINQRKGGGASAPRVCLTLPHSIAHTLYDQFLRCNVTELDDYHLLELVVKEGCLHGVIAYEIKTGEIVPISTKTVVIATGGYGRIYWNRTTNPMGCTGDGTAACLNVGIPLKDPEFIQFHPTALSESGILISEGARSEGGYLFNNLNERFMARYAPEQMELATRDLVSYAIEKEIEEGRGYGKGPDAHVLLDLRHLGRKKIRERLAQVHETAVKFAGIDPAEQPLPIRPSCHFVMGGIDIADYHTCATVIPGIFAAGECACVSIHGANRLGGNALSEIVIFGKFAGTAAAAFASVSNSSPPEGPVLAAASRWKDLYDATLRRKSALSITEIRNRMAQVMWNNVGITRNNQGVRQALSELDALLEEYPSVSINDAQQAGNLAFVHYTEIGNMLTVAKALALGALNRLETRGCHLRSDYPKTDNANFLMHTLVTKMGDTFFVNYGPVNLTNLAPQGR